MNQVPFDPTCPSAAYLMGWHSDVIRALQGDERAVIAALGDDSQTIPNTFIGMNETEVKAHFIKAHEELELLTCLALLACAEAVLRKDFLLHVYAGLQDPVSLHFTHVYRQKNGDIRYVRLEDDILKGWSNTEPTCKPAVSEFYGALKLRNWIAHGRWWEPKLGRKVRQYTALFIFNTADVLFKSLPGVTGWPA